MFSYRYFISEAIKITKNYKHFWFFGLFASLIYASGEFQIVSAFLKQNVDGSFIGTWSIVLSSLLNKAFWLGLLEISSVNLALFWAIVSLGIIALILFLLVLYISITSQAALIDQIKKALASKRKMTSLNIADGLQESKKWFWPILWLNVGSKILITLCFILLSIPLFFATVYGNVFSIMVYVLIFLIFLPIALFISFVAKYAIASCIIENKNLLSSIKRAWDIFKKNWLISFEMAFILFAINALVGLVTMLIVSLFFVSLYIVGILISATTLVAISLLLGIATMAFSAALLGVFQTSVWTNLYLKLIDKKAKSKIQRIFEKK